MRIAPKNWKSFQHYKDRKPPWIRLHRSLLDNQEFNALPPMACKVLVLLWLLASESDDLDGAVENDAARIAFRMRLPAADVAEAMECLFAFGFIAEAGAAESPKDKTLAEQLREKHGFASRYISDAVRREVWTRDGGVCKACQGAEHIEYDHIQPVSKGGSSEAANVQLLCRTCNRKKRTRQTEHVATPAQPPLNRRTTETETETEKKTLRVVTDTVFGRFWETWPSTERKVGKAKCADVWKRRQLDALADQIIAHVEAMKGTDTWQRGFEPAPLTYLNQRRWEDGSSSRNEFAGVM